MGACHAKASWTSWRALLRRLEMGARCSNASCRSWRLVMHEYVLSCFSERVLKWERAVRMRLVGLGVLLCTNTSCLVFLNAS